jgi:signal transduction histidine kinase
VQHEFALATEPPTPGQRRLAFATIAVLFGVFAITVAIGLSFPFASIQVRVPSFVPVLSFLLFVNDTITAALLFGQFSITRSRGLLIVANAYLFTGLMAVLFVLTFPGEFSPTGLLGAGLQSAAWIYNFWHYGFPLAVIVYAMLLGVAPMSGSAPGSPRLEIILSTAITLTLVFGLTCLATAGEEVLPPLFHDRTHPTSLARPLTSLNTLVCIVALAFLYVRRRSMLDLWLMVVMCAWVSEMAILDVLLYARYTFGFYAGRGFSLVTSIIVLIVLLEEMTRLYARLARSNSALQRERNNRLLSLDAMAASIAHEINQPLSALVTNAGIGLRLLARADADLDEVRGVLKRIGDDGHRASDIIASMRAMFKSGRREASPVDVRDLVYEALTLVRSELQSQGVSVQVNLHRDHLPRIVGDRVQLQQVFINLLMNAIEAMSSVKERERSLLLEARIHGRDDVLITLEDSGPGIDANEMERLFEPFFTTKSHGMGLGLAISRSIIEAHGGRLWVSGRTPQGAIFHVQLPSDVSVDR